tara:strand:+ start:74 stop:667 length:594 start_codon:yes stop_codon:yes gene_type:complete
MDDPFEDVNWHDQKAHKAITHWLAGKNDFYGRVFPVVCKTTGEVADNYQEYLRTNHWKALKKRFYKSQLFKSNKKCGEAWGMDSSCMSCRCKNNLQVHHNTYKRLGQEYLRDLVALCDKCHQAVHVKYVSILKKDPSKSKAWTLKSLFRRLPGFKKNLKIVKKANKEKRKAKKQRIKAQAAEQSARAKARNLKQKGK